ncbi:gluconate 5-dehydrogenase [Paraburkholderia sp. EB58]|jgi:gluconate 5-dehydrogenase|uniref:SDR family oxidoreductase n=1 Tax=Paraburkholderia sp. EB58 TaxID=3035125 RepID=UPI003D238396
MSHLFDLKGRTAVVTGSSRGIGFALAEGLAKAGAKVILNGTSADTVAEAVAKLKAKDLDVLGRAFDVTDEVAVADAFAHWDSQNIQVDILINNAGINVRNLLLDVELSEWQRVIDANLTSAFIVSKEAAKRMIARGKGGKIINLGSIASEAGRKSIGAYSAAKGGVKLLTRSMAAEWAAFNIQANAIGPGYILTEMNTALIRNVEFDTWVKSTSPAQRWAQPEELVGTALYLSSAASSYVNGQIIYVDGGWLAVL